MDVYTAATLTMIGMAIIGEERPKVTLVPLDSLEAEAPEAWVEPPEVEFSPKKVNNKQKCTVVPLNTIRANKDR
jgi:hypothetical protein